ncbi:MAG: hypothetical protein AB1742_02145, partial [bacterium]
KRDRAVWSMDLSISIPSYLLSLWNPDAVRDSLLTLLSQKGKGFYAFKRGYIPHGAFPLNTATGLMVTTSTFSVYVMWWIRGVYSYYVHTGDGEFVRSVFGDVGDAFGWLETQTRPSPESRTPLLYANLFNDLSWDYTIRRVGFSGATNLIWAKAYEEAAWLAAKVMGDPGAAGRWRGRAAGIRKAVFEKGFKPFNLWDARLGRFRHTTMEDSPFTHEVNAQAALYDFVRGKAAHRLLDLIRDRLRVEWGPLSADRRFPLVLHGRHNSKVMPALAAYEVAALMKHRRFAEALDLTRRTWLPMLEQGTGTTFWEWYGEGGGRPRGAFPSLCHPWSAWILEVLTTSLTGIKPAGGGFSVFEFDPAAVVGCAEIGGLSFRVPTPGGTIRGEWAREGAGVAYEAEIPDGIEGRLAAGAGVVARRGARGRGIARGGRFKDRIKVFLSSQ